VIRKWSYINLARTNIISRPIIARYKFKTFRTTTRFKRYTKWGVTRTVRKLNLKLKRRTIFHTFTHIGSSWFFLFYKLKQLIRFIQTTGLLSNQFFLPNSPLFLKNLRIFLETGTSISSAGYAGLNGPITFPLLTMLATKSTLEKARKLNSHLWKLNYKHNPHSYIYIRNFNDNKNFMQIFETSLYLNKYENRNFFYTYIPEEIKHAQYSPKKILNRYNYLANPPLLQTIYIKPYLSLTLSILVIYRRLSSSLLISKILKI